MARIRSGRPYPLGATWDGRGVNFALFSASATKVELCLFTGSGRREIARIELPDRTNEVWHVYISDAWPGTLYGYRVHGPYEPARGHRFNPNKLLIDPYARALQGTFNWSDAHFGYRAGSRQSDLSFDRRDNAHAMPKCRVVDPAFTWGRDRPPARGWDEMIIYELHLRGFTRTHPAVPDGLRGTAAGMGMRQVIDYMSSLGVTAVEFLPVHAFVSDRHLVARGLSNYWGYNTLAYFAPEPRYLSTGSPSEFKIMVSRFHEAGIEVILDVVYNHTAEGNQLGPTLSFRGIDNASYYRLSPENPRYYLDYTGTGNSLNLRHPRVIQLVMDSLRYWVEEMHVDGFRFDLCTTLGREDERFDADCGFFDALRQDPVLSRVKLIAEPWDVGPDGYQLGNYGPGWAEWNDRFRDAVRRYWRGDESTLPELAARIAGSADLFDRRARRPWSTINYVAAHDGFTLHDVTSYGAKHNEANGEENRDGHNENFTANYGVEGPAEDKAILDTRRRQSRNMLATLLFSQGTPMLLAGDEFGRTQRGNNNAYCQDNELSWIDWESAKGEEHKGIAFVRRLIEIRRAHPVLRWQHFLHGRHETDGIKDISWVTAEGGEMTPEQWNLPSSHTVGVLLNGRAAGSVLPSEESVVSDVLLLLLNAQTEAVSFVLPSVPLDAGWIVLIDTNREELAEATRYDAGSKIELDGRSLLLLRLTDGTKSSKV
jgi:glycogen operon protein